MRWLDGITDFNGHEFEQTQGDSDGQRSLVRCSSWGRRVGHDVVTEQQFQKVCPRMICRIPPRNLRIGLS